MYLEVESWCPVLMDNRLDWKESTVIFTKVQSISPVFSGMGMWSLSSEERSKINRLIKKAGSIIGFSPAVLVKKRTGRKLVRAIK